TEAQLDAVRAKYNLDNPCLRQLGNPCVDMYVERVADYSRGDFGENHDQQPVIDDLEQAVPNTLKLFTYMFATWLIAGLVFGMIAAWRRGKPTDYSIRFGTILMGSIPPFLLIITYKFVLAAPLRQYFGDLYGRESTLALMFKPSFDPDNPWLSVAIPGILVGLVGVDAFTRLTRASVLENLRSDYVRTAKAKGLRTSRLMVVHVLRNSMIPISTMVGVYLAAALAGAVFTEGIMNIRGLGKLIYEASREKDIPVIMATVAISAVGVLVVNLIVDLMYAVFDPRIRYE
ncbi:MAG: ABC transporter permease, partial [Stackebrandtia sp.]